MIHLSQSDKRWGKIQLGTCNRTISSDGCFITSLAMLLYTTPDKVNEKLKAEGGYFKGCLLDSDKASKILGIKYEGKTVNVPNFPCVVEVDYSTRPGKQQHFAVWLGHEDLIIDPIDGKKVDYKSRYKDRIVSWRLFHEKSIDYRAKFDDLKGVYEEIHSNYLLQSELRREALNLVSELKSVYSTLKINELDQNMTKQTELRAKEKEIIDNFSNILNS